MDGGGDNKAPEAMNAFVNAITKTKGTGKGNNKQNQ